MKILHFINKAYLVVAFGVLCACNKNTDTTDISSPVPSVSVNISTNINSSQYSGIATTGGTVYLTGGNRGIVLYRLNTNTILAYDRTCTYDISDAGGVVYAETNGTAVCVDCGSTYSLTNGSVITGPSTIGLQSYTTTFNPSTGALTVKH